MISVIDYGAGNLRFVVKTLEHTGETAQPVNNADRLVLPKVCALDFADKVLKTLRMGCNTVKNLMWLWGCNNIIAPQFYLEKSQNVGLNLTSKFIKWKS